MYVCTYVRLCGCEACSSESICVRCCTCVVWLIEFCVQNGATPSHVASEKGKVKCLEVLIAAKADVNQAKEVRW